MNLMGAIGSFMNDTEFKAILQVIYGETQIVYMVTGKAFQRASHGYMIINTCLSSMIVPVVTGDSTESASLVNQTEEMSSSLLADQASLESIVASDTMVKISLEWNKRKTELHARSKTSQWWLNY